MGSQKRGGGGIPVGQLDLNGDTVGRTLLPSFPLLMCHCYNHWYSCGNRLCLERLRKSRVQSRCVNDVKD